MIFQASINTRLVKGKSFFDESMATAVDDLNNLEEKWRHALQNGTLPGHVHTSVDTFKLTMKIDAGVSMGIENKLKTMDAMC